MLCNAPKLHLLLHSADLIEERLRIQLLPLAIRPRQARIVDALNRMGAASQVDLAREFNVSPASMSTMTARLIEGGFISRETNPDELRSNVLRLTEYGEALLEDIRKAWAEVDKIIESAIGPQRADELANLTLALRDALGGRPPGHGFAKGERRRKACKTEQSGSRRPTDFGCRCVLPVIQLKGTDYAKTPYCSGIDSRFRYLP